MSIAAWQPVETAPKVRGKHILMFGVGKPHILRCAFVGYWWDNRWRVAFSEAVCEPTHWMPLPTPPQGIDN
jgi:hypothetical protein